MTWRRTLTGLEPADETSTRWWQGLKVGDLVAVDGRKPRNVGHHRKLWILYGIVVANSDAFETPEQVSYAVKAALGRGEWIRPGKAKRALFIPESISFAAMDQVAFADFYRDAVQAIIRHWLPIGADELELAVASQF